MVLSIPLPTFKIFGFQMDLEFKCSVFEPPLYFPKIRRRRGQVANDVYFDTSKFCNLVGNFQEELWFKLFLTHSFFQASLLRKRVWVSVKFVLGKNLVAVELWTLHFFPSPLYQGNTLSPPNCFTLLVYFLTACKRLWCLRVLAGISDSKN